MLPFLIPTAVRNLPWRLIAAGAAIALLLWAGAWFRGVLADNAAQAVTITKQADDLKAVTEEVERMNRQDAADYALRQNIEAQKVQLSKDLAENQKNLKRAKGLLDEATRNCLDMPLPDAYLDRLPMPPAEGG